MKFHSFCWACKRAETYALQTLKDNVSLLTPEVLDEISTVVIRSGHKLLGKDQEPLKGRCDSFVVETDVHYPTDINLLLDAIRKVIFLIGRECDELGITEWRQYRHIFKKIKKLFNRVRKLKRSTSKDESKKAKREELIIETHKQYVNVVDGYVTRAKQTIRILNGMGIGNVVRLMVVENYILHAERQIDQILRRVEDGKTIPHHEKVFSIFQEHTEWICKGKAGVSQELGLGSCILEDKHGFILHHHVMENQKDVEIAVSMVAEAKRKFSSFWGCSFDRGFYSPQNREDLVKNDFDKEKFSLYLTRIDKIYKWYSVTARILRKSGVFVQALLRLFGDTISLARRRYRVFVEKGIAEGKRQNLTGGGLIRSIGGSVEAKALRKAKAFQKGDERILGDGDFVEAVLSEAKEAYGREYRLKAKGIDVDRIAERVAEIAGIDVGQVWVPGKQTKVVKARSLLCHWATSEFGVSQAWLSKRLNLS